MPVTAKLSRRFYEQFGDETTNELVEWFNSVDATYRADLRELNELNFARFDAKLEQRAAQLDAKIDRVAAELNAKIDRVAADLNAKIDRVAAGIGARLDVLQATLLQRLEERIGASRRELLLWMLGSWASVMVVLLGTLFAVLKTR
jgi:DNA anti-recombination protein RmuC